jgi:DNA invertase Pin-like site-specific DNA recombinase
VGAGDTLVVWRLDRLGRSFSFHTEINERIREHGVGFQSLADQIEITTITGNFLFRVMRVESVKRR